MREFEKCEKCRQFDWVDSHECPPLWACWWPDLCRDTREEADMVPAGGPGEAAVEACSRLDTQGDYPIITSKEAHVMVEGLDGKHFRVEVRAQMVPEYWADSIVEVKAMPSHTSKENASEGD